MSTKKVAQRLTLELTIHTFLTIHSRIPTISSSLLDPHHLMRKEYLVREQESAQMSFSMKMKDSQRPNKRYVLRLRFSGITTLSLFDLSDWIILL